VAQFWAGKRWGAFFWPRVKQEVVVTFLEGDPDRPLIVGSVYNAENMPPETLPKHQTRSGVKTHSTPGGGPDNFNEIRFEDRKGQEEIYLHAERDLNTVVEADESRSVGGKRTTTIGAGESLTVKKNGRDTTIEHGSDVLNVDDGPRETYVKKGHDLLVVNHGDAVRILDQGNDLVQVKSGDAVRSALSGTYAVLAKEVLVQGMEKITFTVGTSVITLAQTGITISAPEIHSLAAGIHEIKGGMVNINC
jgi:type VI secretion system secreted protein VgrG